MAELKLVSFTGLGWLSSGDRARRILDFPSSLTGLELGIIIFLGVRFCWMGVLVLCTGELVSRVVREVSVVFAPKIFARVGWEVESVTNLAVMMTFWLGPGGPSVLSFTETPNELPPLCRGMK